MGNVKGRFCFYNLLSFLLILFVFFLSTFLSSLPPLCLFGSSLLFFLLSRMILYSLFSFGSSEFEFLIVTSYFGSFLHLALALFSLIYTGRTQIQSYILASCFSSYNYILLVCLLLQNVSFFSNFSLFLFLFLVWWKSLPDCSLAYFLSSCCHFCFLSLGIFFIFCPALLWVPLPSLLGIFGYLFVDHSPCHSLVLPFAVHYATVSYDFPPCTLFSFAVYASHLSSLILF